MMGRVSAASAHASPAIAVPATKCQLSPAARMVEATVSVMMDHSGMSRSV
jgi:hypothetical protein